MSSVARFELVLLLLTAVIGLELIARRLRMPPAAAFILGGIALALIPGTPDIELDPDLALVLFLPPLLLSGAYFTVWRDFRANLRIILQLAIGAVVFTTAAVGVVVHWMVPGLPWAACFALGAIVSPPDAVAAKAVLQRIALPPRVTVLLEGESLVNDATGLVLYRFAVAAALTGTFSASSAVINFGALAIGGVAVGFAFGWLVTALLLRMRDPTLTIISSFLAAWVSYIVGEQLHVSGVLSTVTCGLVMGWKQHTVLSAATRTQAGAVWEVVGFILESLIFVLIGLSLRGVLLRLGGNWNAIESLIPGALATIAAVIVARFVWIIPATYVPRALSPSLRRADPYPPFAIPIVMSWAGMRGVVSLAAALALPQDFAGRDFILVTTFAVILVTVLVQGSTLGPLIRALRPEGFKVLHGNTLHEDEARARMVAAQLAEVERRSLQEDKTHRHPRLVEQYTYRARATARFSETAGALISQKREHFTVVLAAICAGRVEILRLHSSGSIHDSVLHALEHDLDLEEVTARRYLGEP
ncbi:MAG TPA: Na+/H+ antiporter [Steroidobacteraceae bacterium]|nr:Na+/H+ antiporter [Steroidobacteraceae bacterium]